MQNKRALQVNTFEYVGVYSGLGFLRKPVGDLLKANNVSPDAIIYVQRVGRNDSGNAHKHTVTKKIQKGRKSIEIKKDFYFTLKVTKHNAFETSILPMPVRSWEKTDDGHWQDWSIPQSAKGGQLQSELKKKLRNGIRN